MGQLAIRFGESGRPAVRVPLAALALASLVGCGAGTSFHGYFEAAQWTPEFDGWAQREGGNELSLVGDAGVADDDAFWSFEGNIQLRAPRSQHVGAYAFNLGYFGHTYRGSAYFDSLDPLEFAGETFSDTDVRTVAKFDLWKFTYEEPGGMSGRSGRTGGLLGLHHLIFTVECSGGGTKASYHGNAPMLVFGWRISYSDRGLIYYFSAEGMDLDVISLDNVKGSVLDTSAGIRWLIGKKAALSLGYRSYEADLDIKHDKLHLRQEGTNISLFIMW